MAAKQRPSASSLQPSSPSPPPSYLDADAVERIRKLELFVSGAVEGARVGMHRSVLHGLSSEFTHHRPYTAGDEVKHVDWKVYSRTDRYHLKQFEAETNFEAHLLFDASSSMRYGSGQTTKLEYAKRLAAALAYLIVEGGDSVGLAVFDDQVRDYLRPIGRQSVIADISETLYRTEGVPRTDVGGIVNDFAARIKRRGFVIVFSDLLEDEAPFVKALNHLRFRGHQVIVFQILDPDELTFPFAGIVRFQGLEDEPELRMHPDRIRADYLDELESMMETYRKACEAIEADYVVVDTARPVQDVLVEYLTARRVLHERR